MISTTSFIKDIGLAWKLAVGMVAGVIGFALLAIALASDTFARTQYGGLMVLVGLGLGVASMVWMCASVRCPHCGLKVLLKAWRQQPANAWLWWLFSLAACPRCGSGPDPHSPP